ncbi:MAG: YdcF family protein [Clostridium sp.]|uniref:YdcF family protein n=1 Tax=Clostridium sp. TaxID=1506 RepID=UPI002900659D|nr:YdcF family protein [Clostridium sp.]MDU1587356.1 YdcF family protein [Clostridium sp.]MDU1979476.1 YdcF family protein [Clostridium sp.]MDU1995106.1 YdcF family protein [Clostridium sp.]MDU6049445.1 YdcF family protein [Clostridium sp.]MDU6223207.1 YdcF family protein [Clostridium sp.]
MKKNLDIVIGGILTVYSILVNVLSFRKIAFSEVFLIAGIVFILYHFIKKKIYNNEKLKLIDKVIKIFVCIGLVAFFIIEGIIICYPKNSTETTDYIIVLGAGLNNRNELSQTLRDRLNTALDCLNKYNKESYIVVSGGQGEDEDMSEAEAMEGYLLENGVSKDRIIKEDKSRNTSENFKFSKEKIQEHSNKDLKDVSVKIITTDFHAFRSSMLAKRNGYENIEVYSSNTVNYLVPVFYTRESVALVKSYFFDR